MKCDNIKLCKINILVSTFRTFDNRDKALICPPHSVPRSRFYGKKYRIRKIEAIKYWNTPLSMQNCTRNHLKHFLLL